MKRHTIITASATVTLAAIAGFWPRGKNEAPKKSSLPRAAASVTSTSPPDGHRGAYNWVVGTTGTWSFQSGMALSPLGSEPGGGLEMGGLLHLRVLSAGPERVEAAAILTAVQTRREGQREAIIDRMLENTPCLVCLHPDGRVLETRFAGEVPETDRQLVRLACGWEFVLRDKARWTVQEIPREEKGGTFSSVYRRLETGGVEKTRTFSDVADATGGQRVLHSRFIGQPGSLWLDSLEGRESTELLIKGQPMAQSLVTILMNRLETTAPLPPLLASAFPASPEARAEAFTAAPGRQPRESVNDTLYRRTLAARWGAVSVADILAGVTAVGGKSMQDKLTALHAAQEWLTVHGPKDVIAALRGGLAQEDSGLLIHALGGADHRGDALAELLESPDQLTPAALMQAIVESGAATSPDQRLLKALADLTSMEVITGAEEDYRPNDAAWYSLGRLAEHLPELKTKLESTLRAELGGDPAFTEVALRTLANARTAEPELLAFAAARASDPDADVISRIAAMEVLAQTPQLTPGVTTALSAALQDSQADLQLAALEAISNQKAAVEDATITAKIQPLLASPNESVAAKAKMLLGQ